MSTYMPSIENRIPPKRVRNRMPPRIAGVKKGWHWRETPELLAWRQKLLARALACDPGSGDQRCEINRIVLKIHRLPNGTRVRVSKSRAEAWVRSLWTAPAAVTPTELAPLQIVDGRPPLHPVELPADHHHPADTYRVTGCLAYNRCLGHAVRSGWQHGFQCGECSGPDAATIVQNEYDSRVQVTR